MNQIDRTLESRFGAFLESLENSENLDDTSFDAKFSMGKRADFILDERRVVLELKSLEADPEYKIEDRLAPHRNRPEFPAYFWKADLNEILRHLPDGEEIRREIFHSVTRAVQSALEKADDQIEATKTTLAIPDACGVVAILNEHIDILSPEYIAAKASQMLLKTKNGKVRYRNIAYVLIVSESHRLVHKNAMKGLPMILLEGPTADRFVQSGDYLVELQAEWAAYLGVRFVDLGRHEDFGGLDFEKRSVKHAPSPENEQLTRHEVWRRAYCHNPYLSSLSEEEFLKHTAGILGAMAPHFLKGGRKLEHHVVANLMERWTHALVEAEHRRLDMNKLQKWLPEPKDLM